MARPRSLREVYRALKARYRAKSSALAAAYRENRELRSRLDMEELNGMAIMASRDYIEKKLGVNSARIPGLNITSPFFDDIVAGLVDTVLVLSRRLAQARNPNSINNQWLAHVAQAQQVAMLNQASTTSQYPPTSMLAVAANNATVYATTSTSNSFITGTTSVSGLGGGGSSAVWAAVSNSHVDPMPLTWTEGTLEIKDGQRRNILLPDGTLVEVDADGSYRIVDKDAKVVYRASRVREFNRYINASDLLRDFIKFCGDAAQVTRQEMLDLPIKLFIGYLVLEAAKADGEPEPTDVSLVPDLERVVNPPCQGCGAQLPQDRRLRNVRYCGPSCFERHEREAMQCEAA